MRSTKERVPVPRWVADAVQAMALAHGVRATAKRLALGERHVEQLAGMLPVSADVVVNALEHMPLEYVPLPPAGKQ